MLKQCLVPLAEEVNNIALAGVRAEDIAATRRVLLAVIENTARDAEMVGKPLPSTRAMGELLKRADLKRRKRARS